MPETKICPACQFENELSAILCQGCAVLLPKVAFSQLITEQVAKTRSEATKAMPAIGDLPDLSPQMLAVFAAGYEEPIFLEEVDEVILGRSMDGSTERVLDLTFYKAIALGVSRRHAMIQFRDAGFVIQDLGSTNGVQLNDEPMVASRAYRLRPFDQITLGRLKLMVYFQTDGVEDIQSIMLEDVKASPSASLTPQYLTEVLLPYLQSLNDLQQVYRACLEQPLGVLQIRQIQAAQANDFTRVQLAGADDVIKLVRQWIVPWQKINSAAESEKGLMVEMALLVASMSKLFPAETTAVCQERLLEPVIAIATSGIILMVETAVN